MRFFNQMSNSFCTICDALRDLVPSVQFKKRENTHGGVLRLVKVTTPPGVFFTFLICTNVNKSHKASHIMKYFQTLDQISGKTLNKHL